MVLLRLRPRGLLGAAEPRCPARLEGELTWGIAVTVAGLGLELRWYASPSR
jgi:hypothetical protein